MLEPLGQRRRRLGRESAADFTAAAFALFLAVSAASARGGEIWRLGKADGSPDGFLPYRAWEYGSAPNVANSPEMDAATHTWRFAVPATGGLVAAPRIPSSLCSIFESVFMRDEEVVTCLELFWDESAPGFRVLRVDCCNAGHMPENGPGGVEISLPDGRRRLYDIPARGADGSPPRFSYDFAMPVAPGRNAATIRVVSPGKHESVTLDSIALVESDVVPEFPPLLEIASSDPDGVFHPGGDARLALRLSNADAGLVRYEVRDIASNVVFRGEAEIAGGHGEAALPADRLGWFGVSAAFRDDEASSPRPCATAATSYCVLEPPEEGFIDSSRFGCHAVGGDGYFLRDTALRRERTERALRRARLAGAKWARLHYLSWALREPERGRDVWDGLDERLDLAAQNGLRVLVNVVGVPRWASPAADGKLTVTGEPRWKMAAPSDLAAWSNFVIRLVSRCKGRVSDWEIGNEPGYTSAFWTTGSPEDFAAYLKAAFIAAHAADPACRVYPGAPLDAHFLEETVAAAGGVADFDTLSVHYLGNAKRFSSKAAGWRALRDAIAPGLAIVNSEDMDWHSERGSGPLAVASAMVKLHVRDAAAGVSRTFAFQPFIQGSPYSFHDVRGAPLPAFAAYRAMTHRLEGAVYVGDLSTRECEAYVFDRAGTPVTVFWNALSVPAAFRATLGGGSFTAVDFMDNESPAAPGADGLLALPATPRPRYVEGGDWDAIRAALAQSTAARAEAATTHPLGENLVPPGRRAFTASGRRFETVVQSVPVRYGDTCLFAAAIRGAGTLDGIVAVHDADGNELWPRKQGLNCLRDRHAGPEWKTVADTFTIADEKAATLRLVLVADFREEAAGAPIEVRDITVAQISETHSASKALHRGAFGTDAFGPPIAIPGATARLALGGRFVETSLPEHTQSGRDAPTARPQPSLHLRFEVEDDAFDPPDGPENCWLNDSIQFAIDPRDDGADFTSFRLLRTADGRDILYKDRNYTTPELPDDITRRGVVQDAEIAFRRTPSGYFFDLSIPVRELYPLKADAQRFGFNFLVNDSDGGPREWREWTEGIGGTKTAAPFGHLDRETAQTTKNNSKGATK